MKNFRRNARKKCLVPVDAKKGGAFERTVTIDISRGGLGFVSDRAVAVNDEIAVELELSPEGDCVIRIGRVKWVKKVPAADCYRFGMELAAHKPRLRAEEKAQADTPAARKAGRALGAARVE